MSDHDDEEFPMWGRHDDMYAGLDDPKPSPVVKRKDSKPVKRKPTMLERETWWANFFIFLGLLLLGIACITILVIRYFR